MFVPFSPRMVSTGYSNIPDLGRRGYRSVPRVCNCDQSSISLPYDAVHSDPRGFHVKLAKEGQYPARGGVSH
jgi:hypothetical protein